MGEERKTNFSTGSSLSLVKHPAELSGSVCGQHGISAIIRAALGRGEMNPGLKHARMLVLYSKAWVPLVRARAGARGRGCAEGAG